MTSYTQQPTFDNRGSGSVGFQYTQDQYQQSNNNGVGAGNRTESYNRNMNFYGQSNPFQYDYSKQQSPTFVQPTQQSVNTYQQAWNGSYNNYSSPTTTYKPYEMQPSYPSTSQYAQPTPIQPLTPQPSYGYPTKQVSQPQFGQFPRSSFALPQTTSLKPTQDRMTEAHTQRQRYRLLE